MASDVTDWDGDLPADPEEDYQTFVRTLERTKGFRLLFVQCTPAAGEQLIAKVKEDIPQKKIEFLQLHEPIDNLYKIVERLPKRKEINILFIQGLEHSFYEYEKLNFGNTTERDFYSWEGVPQILNHLNQQRERFRDEFNICFVFLLGSFLFKYFIHRAPDFFDWRSSVFEFSPQPEQWAKTLIDLGNAYTERIRGDRSENLEQAIAAYQSALQVFTREAFPKQWAKTLINLGNAYTKRIRGDRLENLEIAIAAYQSALQVFTREAFPEQWAKTLISLGNALHNTDRYEEAIKLYKEALNISQIIADRQGEASSVENLGDSYYSLGQYQKAIEFYSQALDIQPNTPEVWYKKACSYALQGNVEQAIENLQQAINLSPDKYREMAKTNSDFDKIREDDRFGALIQEALPDR